jgi:hypothetical protein
MIQKTLRTIKGKLKVCIPTALNEVTLGQMIAMQEKPNLNDLEAIAILSGISLQELQNIISINELQAFSDPIQSLSYQIKYLYNSEGIPKKVTFQLNKGCVTVKVMNNLSVEPAGAFMAARDIIADEINKNANQYAQGALEEYFSPSLKACCQVLAHYFYCRATGKKYNEYEAEEFCNEIKKLRVTEALPIAKHFFTCYPALSKPKTSYLHRLLQYWKKKLEYNRSKNSGISTL